MKYKTILIDPPWNEKGAGKCKRGADRHYKLMKTEDIFEYCVYKISPLTSEDCHLYLWVTNNFLESGLQLIKDMGFRYITNLVWVKDKFGLGRYFRGQHELCLFAVKGKFISNSKKESTLIKGLRQKHSQKPYDLYRKIERVSSSPRLEIFARQRREGWNVMGNEVPKETQTLIR